MKTTRLHALRSMFSPVSLAIGVAISVTTGFAAPAWAAAKAKDGDGALTVTPVTAVAGSPADAAFAFRNDNRGPFNAGSQLELTIPAGWTVPQGEDSGAPGYVSIASVTGTAAASLASISGSGPWTVLVSFTADKGTGNGFNVNYANAASASAGTNEFAVRTRQAGGTFTALGTSPLMVVSKAQASVTLGNLTQAYDGSPRVVTATTIPAGLQVAVMYNGSSVAPVAAGAYAVVATVVDPVYDGTAFGTLVVRGADDPEPVTGLETFDYLTYTGSSYQSGTFLGQDGSTWTYGQVRGDATITGRAATLDKAKGAFIRSGTISGGIGVLTLNYRKAGTQNVNCDVYVNNVLAGTISGGDDGTVQTWTSGELNVRGDVVLMFTNNVNCGSITLDDMAWTFSKMPAAVVLGNLAQTYDGIAKNVSVTTDPPGLAVNLTYNGNTVAPTAAGVYAVMATVNDANYEGSASGTLMVGKGTGPVTLSGLEQTYDGTSRTVTAVTVPAGLSVALTYNGNVEAPVDAGSYAVAATVMDANYDGAASGTLEVAKAPASVLLGNLVQVYDGTPKPVSAATDPDGLPVEVLYAQSRSRSFDPNPPTSAGSYAVAATVEDENHEGFAGGTLQILKADQAINFPVIPDQVSTNVVQLAATASSGLPVDYAVASGPAVINGTQLAFTNAGPVAIVASQPGNANWNPASSVTRSFDVTLPPSAPVISRTTVNVREAGEGRFFVSLDHAPTGNVVVTVTRFEGDSGLFVKSGATLTFTSANWNWWQAVTLAANEDTNGVDETAVFCISTPGVSDHFITATALDDDIGTNVALASGGATITGEGTCRPEQAIDGIHCCFANYGYTLWMNTPAGEMILDLKARTAVSRIRLLNWDWLYPVFHQYRLEASLNGTDWTVIVDASTGEHSGWEDWTMAGQAIRYLRFTGLSNSANVVVCIPELEVYGVREPLPAPVLSRPTVNVHEAGDGRFFVHLDRSPEGGEVAVSVARISGEAEILVKNEAPLIFDQSNWDQWQVVTLSAGEDVNSTNETAIFQVSTPGTPGVSITAIALDDDIGENLARASSGTTITGANASQAALAIDGEHLAETNYAYTVWTSTPPGALTMDLQTVSTLSRVRLLSWNWTPRAQNYRVEASLDGASWTLLADACTGGRCGWEDWDGAGLKARYLRFTGVSSSIDETVRLAEWEVYGTRAPLPRPQIAAKRVNVREAGEGRIFVRLDRAPEQPVVLTVSQVSGDTNIVVASGALRSFSSANWSTWQTVTLTAAADDNADGETAVFRVSLPGAADQFVTATALDDDIGQNLALAANGTTIKGSRAANVALVIDGVHASSSNFGQMLWTNDPPGTMTLDLQAEKAISRIRLLSWDWTYRAQRYQIEASVDGANWVVVADASTGDHNGWEDWDVSGQTYRYLRLTGLCSSANPYMVISELEVYAAPVPAVRRTLAAKSSLKAVASEVVSVLTSDGAADETGWVGQKVGGGYVVVEYAPALTLKSLEVDLAEGSLTNIEYLYSADAVNWQPLPEDLESNPVEVNYLWLVFPDDGSDAVPQVLEIRPNP